MKQYTLTKATLYCGDSGQILSTLPDSSISTAITSPPYYQKMDYNNPNQLGLENSIDLYLDALMGVFNQVQRVLVDGGVFWVIIGDTYNNYSPIRGLGQRKVSGEWHSRRPLQPGYCEKELLNVPAKLVDRMRFHGWKLRQTLIWDKGTSGEMAKGDSAPSTHEFIFQFVKWDADTGRLNPNCKPLKSSVISIPPVHSPDHPCPFPPKLAGMLIRASSEVGETVLDPFCGSGTSLIEAVKLSRRAIGIDLNPDYCESAIKQLNLFAN